MALRMAYHRRKRIAQQGESPPLFRVAPFGQKLLTQLFQNFEALDTHFDHLNQITSELCVFVREETGQLSIGRAHDRGQEFALWWFNELPNADEEEHDLRLSVVEVACDTSLAKARHLDRTKAGARGFASDYLEPKVWRIVETINARMLEDGFGYQFNDGKLIELTSEFAYENAVDPALTILSNKIFASANSEFRDAFEEYKQGRFEDCISDCGNAFESVIKVIAAQLEWDDLIENANAAKLIDALYTNKLIPVWMQEQMKGLKMILQGTSTVRNKSGGHGAGSNPREVPKHLAAYQLNQTAAAIVFLAQQARLA